MTLTRLRSPEAAARWLREWTRGTLRTDSRQVRPGDAFIAWPGYATDGRRYVQAALAAGAATCLVEDDGVDAFGWEDARIATLPRLKAATGIVADAFFEQPGRQLAVIATTGTNGKTSTTWWIAQALSLLGRRCGVAGTLGIGMPPLPGRPARLHTTGLTTPDPVQLHAALRGLVDDGAVACAIEASSIGLVEHRLAGVPIDTAVFTNFTRDHLDYHGTMQAYWQAKRALFDWPGLAHAVVNVDDERGGELADALAARGRPAWTYGILGQARLRACALRYEAAGLAFDVVEDGGGAPVPVASTLIGDYNASNLLAVLGALRAGGLALADAAAVVPRLTPVPGRMQRVEHAGAPEVVVDYAHTPDALEKALVALRPLARARSGRLWCVFGCGGDRDATKRPMMGAIADRLADSVVVTSDNPRSEAPRVILAQILAGVVGRDSVAVIEDRREAIEHAVRSAQPADVVLLAGKGHEDYQEVDGVRHPFDDVTEAHRAQAARGGTC